MNMSETSAQIISTADSRPIGRRRRRVSLFILALSCFGMALAMGSGPHVTTTAAEPPAQMPFAGFHATAEQTAEPDYARFAHTSGAHNRLPCATCHRRDASSPQANRPGHRPCAACHSQKFAALSGPICTVCHTSTEPKTAALKPMKGLQGFAVKFDHARHTSAACTTCHKPASRGAALSIPTGATAHATCYQCHTSRAQADGRDLSSCGVCHAPGRYERVSMSAKAYRVNFSHAEHRQKLNCNDCHRAKGGAPQDQMTQPVPAMHRASGQTQNCKSCHNNQRAFGGDDFSDCKRCHQGQTFRFGR